MAFGIGTLVALALSAGGMAGAGQDRVAEPAERVFGRAEAEVALKTEVFRGIFEGERYDWSVDLDAGTITFTSATRAVTAPVQVIGTYDRQDGTFLWGWDHPSIPEPQRADARLARRFGELQNLSAYTTRLVECTEEEAWRFTAVALYLSGAQGAYRGPAGSTLVFMTFGNMTITSIR